MAEAISRDLNIQPELIKSGGGVFEIEVDGELIFSKKASFRFPETGEIITALKKKMV